MKSRPTTSPTSLGLSMARQVLRARGPFASYLASSIRAKEERLLRPPLSTSISRGVPLRKWTVARWESLLPPVIVSFLCQGRVIVGGSLAVSCPIFLSSDSIS